MAFTLMLEWGVAGTRKDFRQYYLSGKDRPKKTMEHELADQTIKNKRYTMESLILAQDER